MVAWKNESGGTEKKKKESNYRNVITDGKK